MQILGKIEFNEVLAQWGLHEGKGRYQNEPPEIAPQVTKQILLKALNGPNSLNIAIEFISQRRAPLIDPIKCAEPIECFKVQVVDTDLNRIQVMCLNPHEKQTEKMIPHPLVEHAVDWHSRKTWVKSLVSKDEQMDTPLVAVGRTINGLLTLLDGLHRASAWVIQGQKGKRYPIIINVVLTRHRIDRWECPV